MPLWALVAAVNLALGLALAANPDRQSDLETVRRWTHAWLFDGVDLYAPLTSGTDYPPHAILFLSPLALLPGAAAAPLWMALNLLLAVLAPVLAARIARPGVARADTVCLAILFLGWSGTKALLQFTLLTLVLGLAAMRLAERRPGWSAVCLGLALMKPQIGLPFLLWAGFSRHTRVAVGSLIVVAAGSVAWCVRASADPFHVARRYLEILQVYYAGRGSMVGVSQAGPLIHRLAPDAAASVATGLLSAALLGIVCAAALRARRGPGLPFAVPAMACIWSLTTFYHLTYGFVLLLPLAALLLLADAIEPAGWRLPVVTFWAMQVLLVVDAPGLWRRFGPVTWRTPLTEAVFQDWYRLALIGLFAAAWAIQRRIRRPAAITV
jgi:hypothetical protein